LKMKLIILIIVAIVAAFAFLAYWGLHTTKMAHVTFSDDKDIVSDGLGLYVERSQHISAQKSAWGFLMQLFDDQGRSNRFVSVRFGNAYWKDANLQAVTPVLPTSDYRMAIQFGSHYEDMFKANIGKQLEPFIWLVLDDMESGERIIECVRDLTPPDNATYPAPPSVLYKQGNASLVRESEDIWILDVNAWFRAKVKTTTYYVLLGFRLTLEYESLI